MAGELLAASEITARVVARLRQEIERLDLSQTDLAQFLGWTQSKVAQKLNGRSPITLDELEGLARTVNLAVTEVVRDHGYEFCAEMTPSELIVLRALRSMTPEQRESFLTIFRTYIKEPRQRLAEGRRASKPRPDRPARR